MDSVTPHLIDTRFRAEMAARTRSTPRAPIIGLENEFYIFCNERQVDARALIWRLARFEEHPPFFTFRGVCKLASGAQLSADRACAETAMAPELLTQRGLHSLCEATISHRNRLLRLVQRCGDEVGGRRRVEGFSTHINLHFPSTAPWGMCNLLGRTVLPAYFLLTERPVSGGMMLRPRPMRVEIGGEYIAEPQTRGRKNRHTCPGGLRNLLELCPAGDQGVGIAARLRSPSGHGGKTRVAEH